MIAGGALAEDNRAIVSALLDRRPAQRRRIVIIAAASAEPAASGAHAASLFARHGAAAGDLVVARLAAVDDPSTTADEAQWTADRLPAADLRRIARAGAIWFTGGDQQRLVGALLLPDGRDSPVLAAIRAAHAKGAVIGGTSAGAAALSDPMIRHGDPVAAVGGAGEGLALGQGLGFVAGAIIDQHFDARYRLPRLLAALARQPEAGRIGLGVSEDTALVLDKEQMTAIGRGLVTIVDARAAQMIGPEGPGGSEGAAFLGLGLRFLADGQSLPWKGADREGLFRPRAAAPKPLPHIRP